MMTSKHPFINTPGALGPPSRRLDSKQSTGTAAAASGTSIVCLQTWRSRSVVREGKKQRDSRTQGLLANEEADDRPFPQGEPGGLREPGHGRSHQRARRA